VIAGVALELAHPDRAVQGEALLTADRLIATLGEEGGFKTLRASSLEVVLEGRTTLEEMWRVSTEDFLVGE